MMKLAICRGPRSHTSVTKDIKIMLLVRNRRLDSRCSTAACYYQVVSTPTANRGAEFASGVTSEDVIGVFSLGISFCTMCLGRFGAPMGNLFLPPQTLHWTTSTSAQGFRPPLLAFSILWVAVRPGMRIVLQLLHKERFSSTESRS